MKLGLLIAFAATLFSFSTIATAEDVEIALLHELDTTTNNFCLDIMGGNQNVDPSRGLQAHTCFSYRGAIGPDQAVTLAGLEEGRFHISGFDVCVTMTGLEEGASVALETCGDNDLQLFDFVENGTISPKGAPNMCVTVDEETTYGRAVRHQIRQLSLLECSEELASRQLWFSRNQADYDASLATE